MKLQNDILTLQVLCRNTSMRCHTFWGGYFVACQRCVICSTPRLSYYPTWVTFADRLWSLLSSWGWCYPVCRRTYQRFFHRLFAPSTHLTCSFLRVSRHFKHFSPGKICAACLSWQFNKNRSQHALSKKSMIIKKKKKMKKGARPKSG